MAGQSVKGLAETTTGPSNLFRRSIDNILAPYAKAVTAEGYRFSTDRFTERFGLTGLERGSYKDVFSAYITKEEHGYDTDNESATAGRTSLEKRNNKFREEVNRDLRERIAAIAKSGEESRSSQESLFRQQVDN